MQKNNSPYCPACCQKVGAERSQVGHFSIKPAWPAGWAAAAQGRQANEIKERATECAKVAGWANPMLERKS